MIYLKGQAISGGAAIETTPIATYLTWPGKAMAYAAVGEADEPLVAAILAMHGEWPSERPFDALPAADVARRLGLGWPLDDTKGAYN